MRDHDKISRFNSDKNNMKPLVIFVQDRFFLGGIEVLELKLVEELARLNYQVVVASRDNDTLAKNTSNFTHFIHSGYPDFISRLPTIINNDYKGIIFVSLHPTAAMAAELAGRKIRKLHKSSPTIYHFHWVSHSRAFFFSQWLLAQKLYAYFFKLLPAKSTYFMNDASKLAHQSFWRISLDKYPIIRIVGRKTLVKKQIIPNIGTRIGELRCSDLRIVSVGRLVPFKSYNINAPSIIRRLLDLGVNVTWDIWGYGPDEPRIFYKAREQNVADKIRLLGALPHSEFDETVSAYDVFVGMGTSVLEAAKTGTPSCVAVENHGDASYGFLHEAPTDSVGDQVEGFRERRLHEVLHLFSTLDTDARAKIGEADAQAAQQKESTIENFVGAILSAAPMRQIGLRHWVTLAIVNVYLKVKHWKRDRMNN